jgi:predicted RNA methylase
MNRDDIIRSYLELHSDTPINMKEYAVPLRIISRMLESVAAAEREECAKVCDLIAINACDDRAHECGVAIRARGQQ